MKKLMPDRFDLRFADLLEIGRARLHPLAPDWTDYNAHDPGITLMELLAWTTEAQLYSLSRLRRDEREAFAALFGLAPSGVVRAQGILWPDHNDPQSPAATYAQPMLLSTNSVIHVQGADGAGAPTFRPTHTLWWAPGCVDALVTRHADGRIVNHTAANGRNVAFQPFGERAGQRDVLAISFKCRDEAGLFGSDRRKAKGALWAIGVMAAPALTSALSKRAGAASEDDSLAQVFRAPLSATLFSNHERIPLRIEADTTHGMLTTGVILLNLDDLNVISVPPSFTIEFSAPQGFARLPRLLRIEPNVIPIQQGRTIEHELHVEAIGQPDWQFTLDESGLCFAAGDESPITVELVESGMADVHEVWRRCDHLSDAGPNDNVYELDVASRRVTFGNGVNGRVPPSGAKVEVSYSVSDAEAGQVARNRKWKVAGFEGVFGINPQPIAGGAASPGEIERRRKARWRAREDRALVTAEDITRAALALPLLEVARAWMTPPDDRMLHTGVQTLFALRIRPAGVEPEQIPETAQWLGAIHHALSPRLPLGTRLAVEAPRYRSFSIQVTLEAHPRLDPAKLKAQVMQELGKRFTLDGRHDGRLVSRAQTATPRPPGVALTKLDLTVWLRGIEGVKRVTALRLLNAAGKEVRAIAVPLDGLPRWLSEDSFVEIEQSDARKVS